MSTLEQTEPKTPAPAPPAPQRRRPPVRPPRLRWRRHRLAYALIAPAVVFMVLVHLLPMLGGFYLSFKKLNTFTFSQLWGAPWNGLENYRSILFDSENPLHSGFMEAVGNTVQYTFFTVAGTIGGGLAVAVLLNRQMRGIKVVRHAHARRRGWCRASSSPCCGASCGSPTTGSSTRSSSTTRGSSATARSG